MPGTQQVFSMSAIFIIIPYCTPKFLNHHSYNYDDSPYEEGPPVTARWSQRCRGRMWLLPPRGAAKAESRESSQWSGQAEPSCNQPEDLNLFLEPRHLIQNWDLWEEDSPNSRNKGRTTYIKTISLIFYKK